MNFIPTKNEKDFIKTFLKDINELKQHMNALKIEQTLISFVTQTIKTYINQMVIIPK